MIDPKRNLQTTYRIAVWQQEGDEVALYEVSTYPKTPEKINVSAYRFDLLPKWLQEAIHLLNCAYPEEVAGLGRRVGDNTYWVEACDYTNTAKMLTSGTQRR